MRRDWERLDSKGAVYCGYCRESRRLSLWALVWTVFVLVFNALAAGLTGLGVLAGIGGALAGLGVAAALRAWRLERKARL